MSFTLSQVVPWGRSFEEYVAMYSEHLSEDFHVESIQELCRVAGEARLFPLLELGSRKSRHVRAVVGRLFYAE